MIDEFDRKLLRELRHNGRISVQALSDSVGLSPSPCSRRVRILEKSGVIQGYQARIDEAKIGYGYSVFVSVKLDRQVDDVLQAFEAAINSFAEVVDCWLMTGDRDYLLRIAVPDVSGFETFLTSKMTKINGVAEIQSSIPIRCVKSGSSRKA